jgi:ligand-binding SRPBCC domain-containing protein
MPLFVRSVVIEASVERVFAFHEREDALQLLSPAFPPVRLIRRSGGIETGARVVLHVLIFRWVALHTVYQKNRLFVDEQLSGPFARWIHRHEFESFGNRTRLTDRIEYELPGGRLINRLFSWTVVPGLARMFAHRHRVTRKICEAET